MTDKRRSVPTKPTTPAARLEDTMRPPRKTEISRDDAVRLFAKRLEAAMLAKGWNQSELARQAALHMPNGKFGRDNISSYCHARSFPGPIMLKAMCDALGVEPEDLIPTKGTDLPAKPDVDLGVERRPDGMATLRVNLDLPWPKVAKILEIIES